MTTIGLKKKLDLLSRPQPLASFGAARLCASLLRRVSAAEAQQQAAAFLHFQRGFHAALLDGGMRACAEPESMESVE